MAEAKPETTKVKFVRGVNYKGIEFKAGAIADVEPHVAARLIADGHAEEVAEKAAKSEKSEK